MSGGAMISSDILNGLHLQGWVGSEGYALDSGATARQHCIATTDAVKIHWLGVQSARCTHHDDTFCT